MRYILALVALSCTACSGLELGGKLGVYRVDERHESQRMNNVPLKCYLWANCQQTTDVQGS